MSGQEAEKILRDLEANLKIVAKTGKIVYGFHNVERVLRSRKVKVILFARNTPYTMESKIEPLAARKRVPTLKSNRYSNELGELCGRPHTASTLAILDFGVAAVDLGSK
jgi:large subunit ribosomal protein L30e